MVMKICVDGVARVPAQGQLPLAEQCNAAQGNCPRTIASLSNRGNCRKTACPRREALNLFEGIASGRENKHFAVEGVFNSSHCHRVNLEQESVFENASINGEVARVAIDRRVSGKM